MQRGTTVGDALAGEVVATRTAHEKDEAGRRRVIQLFDMVSRQGVFRPVRGISSMVGSDDSPNISGMPAELLANMVEVGDAMTLVAQVHHTESDGVVTLTPIVEFSGVDRSGTDNNEVSSTDGEIICLDLTHTDYPNDGTAVVRPSDAYFGEVDEGGGSFSNYRSIIEFSGVDVPPGATVSSAELDIYFKTLADASTAKIWAFTAVELAGVFAAETALAKWAAIETAIGLKTGVSWDASGESINSWGTSPEIKTIVQEIVDGDEWNRGDSIYLLVGNSASGIGGGGSGIDRDTNLPKITVTHDGGVSMYGTLQSKTTGVGSASIYFFSGSSNRYLSPILSWDLAGVRRVNFHIGGLSAGNDVTVYGGVI